MRTLAVILLALLCAPGYAQEPVLSPNAPPDNPISHLDGELETFESAIAPYITEAKRTYPGAKAKFVAGLPKGQSFFITTRLRDSSGAFEQVFIAVREIEGGSVTGRIWSDVQLVQGYSHGDLYTFSESELIDWLITHPDGSEEGNVVGKFLDTYHRGSGT